ncbi:MAG: hypothetical protein ACN6PH_07670 [Pseudomonas sp.]
MEVRLLPHSEFGNVEFYRIITLLILLGMAGVTLKGVATGEFALLSPLPCVMLIMAGRFIVEWRRLDKSQPAFIHADELVLCGKDSNRQIPLAKISSTKARHSIFMVRRYRSWSEHVAFLELTLNNGERLYTLVESAVFDRPLAKGTVKAIDAAILSAKIKDLAQHQQDGQ